MSNLYPMTRLLLFCSLGLLASCSSKSTGPARDGAVRKDTVALVAVRDDGEQVFSFFNQRAELQHVDRVEKVPRVNRSDVMVTDPARPLPGDLVYVADMRTKIAGLTFRLWVEPRGRWLDRVMPKTSLSRSLAEGGPAVAQAPAKAKKRRVRRRRPVAAGGAATGGPAAPAAKGPRAIMFSTKWCPSCRAARQFFEAKGIPLQELDVEQDQQAQQQYLAITQQYRLKPGAVPLIIVNGQIFQGFAKPQIEAALAQGPPPGAR